MKKLLLIAAVLLYLSTNGQFFHHNYGVNNSDQLTHGFNTNVLGLGHFMVGNSFTSPGVNSLMALRTDVNGSPFLAPNFAKIYLVNDGVFNLSVGRARSFEIPGGAGFGVVAEVSGNTNGLAYITLNPSGNITNIVLHSPVNVGQTVLLAHVVVNDLTNTDAVAVGTIIDNNFSPPLEYPFAYNFDITTGAVNWSSYYDHVTGFTPSVNVRAFDCAIVPRMGLLGVVGRATAPGLTIGDDGFYMLLDVTTGTWLGPSLLYDWAGNEDLKAIHFSAGTMLFAVCGKTTLFGQNDVITMLIPPPPFPPVWGTIQQYNNTSGNITNFEPSDIYTRNNLAGMPEFYVSGTANDGNILGTDAVVYKLDVGLTPVGQFTYGNLYADAGVDLDGYDGTGSDGLSMFGNYTPSAPTTNTDFYHVKSYFNGQSGCHEDIQVPLLQSMPTPLFLTIPSNSINNFMVMSRGLVASMTSFPTAIPLCFNTSIPGGSNAKVAPLEEKADREAKMSPNPVPQGASALLLEVNTEVPVDVEVAIYDMLGKQYYSGMQHLSSGDNRLPINISGINMAQGTYIVKITGIDFNKNLTLLVK